MVLKNLKNFFIIKQYVNNLLIKFYFKDNTQYFTYFNFFYFTFFYRQFYCRILGIYYI